MKQKTKTSILIGVLLVSAGLVALMIGSKKQPESSVPQQAESPAELEGKSEQLTGDPLLKTTMTASGEVASKKENSIILKGEDGGLLELKINAQTSFYAMKDGSVLGKTATDIKEGIRLTAEYDQESKEALAVSIR